MIPEIGRTVKRNSKKLYEPEEEDRQIGFFGKFLRMMEQALPYFENILLFIPFFMLNNRATDSQYFANLDFYLIYVLLFAILFGQIQATFSAVLATAGYIFRQQYTRSGFDVMLDYNTYVWIAQLFILGLVVGYLKDRLTEIRGENEAEVRYLNEQINDLSEVNISNVNIKNVLETQIINQNDSFGRVYEITSQLDQYAPEDVLFYAADVVKKLIKSEDVAIYQVSNRDYALFAATSDVARALGNSIEYRKLTELYEEISNDRVYMNRTLKEGYPLMANGIGSNGELNLIIMVWGIPWDRMNLSQANMLRVSGYLIQNAVLHASRYMEALEHEFYQEGTRILKEEAFKSLTESYLSATRKGLTEAVLLQIDIRGEDLQSAAGKLAKGVRNSDFLGRTNDGTIYALLSNTSQENAAFVIKRFEDMGYSADMRESLNL